MIRIKTIVLNFLNKVRINHDARLIDYIKKLILQQLNANNNTHQSQITIDTQYIIRKCMCKGYSKRKVIFMLNYINFILNNYIPHKNN